MNKKLTNTKGFPLVMMILAFLCSAFGAAQEFIMHFVYEKTFSSDNLVDYVLLSDKGFFDVYGTAVFMFVFTFLVMFVLIGGVGKKTTGTKEGVLLIVTGIASAVTPAVNTILFLFDGKLDNTQSDGELFRAVNELVCYALPVFVSFLIILSGLGILIKAGASKTTVEVFKNKELSQTVIPQAAVASAPVAENVAEKAEEIPSVAVEPVIEEVKPVVEEAVAEEAPKANVCVSCGLEIAEGTKFCRHCGAKQE